MDRQRRRITKLYPVYKPCTLYSNFTDSLFLDEKIYEKNEGKCLTSKSTRHGLTLLWFLQNLLAVRVIFDVRQREPNEEKDIIELE